MKHHGLPWWWYPPTCPLFLVWGGKHSRHERTCQFACIEMSTDATTPATFNVGRRVCLFLRVSILPKQVPLWAPWRVSRKFAPARRSWKRLHRKVRGESPSWRKERDIVLPTPLPQLPKVNRPFALSHGLLLVMAPNGHPSRPLAQQLWGEYLEDEFPLVGPPWVPWHGREGRLLFLSPFGQRVTCLVGAKEKTARAQATKKVAVEAGRCEPRASNRFG